MLLVITAFLSGNSLNSTSRMRVRSASMLAPSAPIEDWNLRRTTATISVSCHSHKLGVQGVEIRLIPELGGEGFKYLGCVVLAAVEATIHERLEQCLRGLKSAAISCVEATTAS